jgi:hypothetical protein
MAMRPRSTLLGLSLAAAVAACAGLAGTSISPVPSAAPSPSISIPASPPGRTSPPASVSSPTPSAAAANYWPFVQSWCPGASDDPLVLVALGTSETAGYGIRSDEPYSPQEAYAGQYAQILCKELGVTVELRSYFPSQSYNEWATLAWWNERLAGDAAIRTDLASAKVVVMWAMGSHDVIRPLMFGGCTGIWPDPLQACLQAATAKIHAEMDTLFTFVSSLVPNGTTILAADAYLPPAMIERWASEAYWPELLKLLDPKPTIMALAEKHRFTFVDTELVFNGPDSSAMPADGLFQSDGLHPTAAGALATAKALAAADGLGN